MRGAGSMQGGCRLCRRPTTRNRDFEQNSFAGLLDFFFQPAFLIPHSASERYFPRPSICSIADQTTDVHMILVLAFSVYPPNGWQRDDVLTKVYGWK